MTLAERIATDMARRQAEWEEADLADMARGFVGGDGPYVKSDSDLMNGDAQRDMGRQ